jgi:hypothetical protein
MKKFTSLKGKAFLFLLFLSSLWFLNFAGRAMFSPVLPLIEDEFRLTALSRIFDLHVRGIATGFIIGCGVVIGGGVTPFLLGFSGDLLSFKCGIMMLGIATILSSALVFLLKEISLTLKSLFA